MIWGMALGLCSMQSQEAVFQQWCSHKWLIIDACKFMIYRMDQYIGVLKGGHATASLQSCFPWELGKKVNLFPLFTNNRLEVRTCFHRACRTALSAHCSTENVSGQFLPTLPLLYRGINIQDSQKQFLSNPTHTYISHSLPCFFPFSPPVIWPAVFPATEDLWLNSRDIAMFFLLILLNIHGNKRTEAESRPSCIHLQFYKKRRCVYSQVWGVYRVVLDIWVGRMRVAGLFYTNFFIPFTGVPCYKRIPEASQWPDKSAGASLNLSLWNVSWQVPRHWEPRLTMRQSNRRDLMLELQYKDWRG